MRKRGLSFLSVVQLLRASYSGMIATVRAFVFNNPPMRTTRYSTSILIMFKKLLILIGLCHLSLSALSQRLYLQDVVNLFEVMYKEPVNAEDHISTFLAHSSSGWKGPDIVRNDGYVATWRYMVGEGTYGRVRFVIQKLNGEPLPKIVYECPYESAFEGYTDDLKKAGAELQDSYNDTDGSLVRVYTLRGFTFMLADYPLNISHFTADGKRTAYFKVLMHPSL
jgi:hypothetical protein